MENAVERGPDWAGLPVIATVARLLRPSSTDPRPVTPSRGGSRSRGDPGPLSRMVQWGQCLPCSEARQMPVLRVTARGRVVRERSYSG